MLSCSLRFAFVTLVVAVCPEIVSAQRECGVDPTVTLYGPFRDVIRQSVTFSSNGLTLSGTLLLPSRVGLCPAVIFQSGSGPNRREGIANNQVFFSPLAYAMCERGFAVLCYDKRGVGKSEGTFADATLLDFASDAKAAIQFLRQRPFVTSIGVLGHSEGALSGTLASIDAEASFLILLAGPAYPYEKVIYDIIAAEGKLSGKNEAVIKQAIRKRARINSVIKDFGQVGITSESLVDALRDAGYSESDQMAKDCLKAGNRFILTYDPSSCLDRVSCQVLAVFGERDIIVQPTLHLPILKSKLGNRLTSKVFANLNHSFEQCETGAIQEYGADKNGISRSVINYVAEWARQSVAPHFR